MQRYLLASIGIGIASLIGLAMLHYTGVSETLAIWQKHLFIALKFLPQVYPGLEQSRLLPLEWLMAVLAAFGVAWCVVDVSQVGQKMLFYLSLIITACTLSFTLSLYGFLFSPFLTVVAASISMILGLIYAGTEKGMRKRVLQNVLGARVSKKTFSELINSQNMVSLEGSRHEASVLTCRLFNHQELKSTMEAKELVALTNRFLHNTADFLLSKGAYLDESSPDCVRVFFGLLAPDEDHAKQACLAALELKQRLLNLDAECENTWFHKLEHGVAISSGQMTVGVYGSPRHYYFSGVGMATDFSRRVCAMNRVYNSDLLISARTYQLVSECMEVRPMEMIYDSENAMMSEVYELLAESGTFEEAEQNCRDIFWEGIISYRAQEYEKALEKFCLAGQSNQNKEDTTLDFFIKLSQQRLSHPELAEQDKAEPRMKNGHTRLLNTL